MKELNFDLVIFGGGIVGTWVAKRALDKGIKIAVIEVGPQNPSNKSEPLPTLLFPERVHIGAKEARNHCLTGNSKFWGGGLITNDEISIDRIFDFEEDVKLKRNMIKECERKVINEFNIPFPNRSVKTFNNNTDLVIAEILVLAGKYRDIWNTFYKKNRDSDRLTLFLNTREINIQFNSRYKNIESIIINSKGEQYEIKAKNFVLAMGIIDSNIFVLDKLNAILENFELVGKRLHDHWSVPIGKIKWKENSFFNNLYPPYFVKNHIIGKRIEIRPNNIAPESGFIHIQASYDTTPPYSILKNLLFRTQKELSLAETSKNILTLFKYFPSIAKLGWEKLINEKLFIPEGTELNIVLDFESYPDPLNSISKGNNNTYNLNWDLRSQDMKYFNALYQEAERVICILANSDSEKKNMSLLREWTTDFEGYLTKNVVDAYHLGGGLNTGFHPSHSIVNRNLQFHNIKNLTVLGTSSFNYPGIANPVLTLLAQSENYTSDLKLFNK